MAWPDCYGEVTPPEEVIDKIMLCSGRTLGGLIEAAQLAIIDRRDPLWHLTFAHEVERPRTASPSDTPSHWRGCCSASAA